MNINKIARDLTKEITTIRNTIADLTGKLQKRLQFQKYLSVLDANSTSRKGKTRIVRRKKRRMSAAGRKAIAAAQKARWAKQKSKNIK